MMNDRERLTVSGLVVLLLLFWLGFLVHRSPRFAGSFWGGALAVSGSTLMLVPLAYLVVKRVGPLKRRVTRHVSMRTLLAWHIYAGVLGPILVILHTGHKFHSPLGVALTAVTLLVVLSGFVGRYLMRHFSQTIREKKEMLTQLEIAYRDTATELSAEPQQAATLRPLSGVLTRTLAGWFVKTGTERGGPTPAAVRALRLSESIADLEYAVKTHDHFKRWFASWLRFHIVISLILYGLLAWHVWAAVYFGLRWFE
ncbi:hypothetical protein [Alienimonas sp. DA493]|uniref:hypothetical protein n=1 Tax=Alienimonas sp. DA493 TaxID=3373605 RepID=UPI003755412F